MKLLTRLNRSAHHHLPTGLHLLPWQLPQEGSSDPEASSFVLAVALVSVAAALVLVLAP
ncbi:hypothetical protein [Roseateles violae]|uniref:Uncharacterized protein n=1 Tax=Roseateles violae TaxID=3058042 RepID=A0ABT8DY52_9BURK|nr:hypothetical protein [Pelomonas sp. PFR6]MDN3922564.1 hypothetical protein [Pelomonas sp. PFR6]